MATMRVTEALDERDLLAKKIKKAINNLKLSAAVKEKDTNVNNKTIEEFEADAKAAYQSVRDMISRYNKLNTAITLSNATSILKFKDGTEMTRAAAIAIRKQRLEGSDFSVELNKKMNIDYNNAIILFDRINREYENQVDSITQSMIANSKDKKNSSALDEQQQASVETFTAPYKPKMVDPIGIKTEIDKLEESIDNFAAEIDTLIKISNVTTEIEIED